jgi:antitoxin (DNA-binding transcriptional repressor) of toxin-antitoxin stability system
MREVTVRELRALLPSIEDRLRQEGELVLTRNGRPLARIIGLSRRRRDNADLRAKCPPQAIPSEVLIREDRDAR